MRGEGEPTPIDHQSRHGFDYARAVKNHVSEPRWINTGLKRLIAKRQNALHKGNMKEFRRLRNKVNRERKVCRARFYQQKVEHRKNCSPSYWWKEIKKLGSMTNPSSQDQSVLKSLHHLEGAGSMSPAECANFINSSFLSPMEKFEPLSSNPISLPTIPDSSEEIIFLTEMTTFKKLSSLNPSKAQGPDGIPGWLLKESADLLAMPVCDVINSSYREGRLPPCLEGSKRHPSTQAKANQRRKQTLAPNLAHAYNL